MYNGAVQNFFFAKTAHRVPKFLTLAASASLLLAMVNIDASASTTSGRNPTQLTTEMLMKVANQQGNREYSGVVKRWSPVKKHPTTTTTSPTRSTPSGGGTPPTTTTTTIPVTTSATTTTIPTTTTTTTLPTTTTTTAPPTTTSTTPPVSDASGGLITAGPSRSECLAPDTTPGDYGLAYLQGLVSAFDSATDSNVTCLMSYLNGAPSWADWVSPWITQSYQGYTSWVAASPQTRELVLQVDLIPDSLENVNDPLSWEQSCAAGDFNTYATQLGQNLVAAGLQNSVLRLGAEMNGAWESDYMGSTAQEQSLWAQCFANEVTGLRQAAGEHFLIDWNPNACTQNVPYSNFYPGNAYVDIMGLDLYDVGCDAPSSPITWSALASEPYGLNAFETFATAQGKPMSFPEWGLSTTPNGDDPAYIAGMGAAVAHGDFAFEAYFDAGAQGMMILGSTTPLSIAAFQQWFGS
jgi:glycosyl hydrolase family 26